MIHHVIRLFLLFVFAFFSLVSAQEQPAFDYSLVVLSDIHIGESLPAYDGSELYSNVHAKAAIKKINEIASSERVRMVFITGDLTDSAEDLEFSVCRNVLDLLTVPYAPCIGNHDIWQYTNYNTTDTPTGDQIFDNVFGNRLRGTVGEGIEVLYKAPPTFNTDFNFTSHFQNYVVQMDGPEGLALVVLDWNSRQLPRRPGYEERGVGPQAFLHDFPGGTIDWLAQTLPVLYDRNVSQIAFLQHHPYRLQIYAPDRIYGFDRTEKARIQEVLQKSMPLSNYFGVIAGHLHRFFEGTAFDEEGFEDFRQIETDTCKGHVTDRVPRNVYGAFTLVRVRDNHIVSTEQFIGPYE